MTIVLMTNSILVAELKEKLVLCCASDLHKNNILIFESFFSLTKSNLSADMQFHGRNGK